jgi:hypothetical protein
VKNVNGYLNSLSPEYKIDNIHTRGDSKFGKVIQESSRKDIVILGDFTYKKNEFITHLESENLTL